MWPPVLPLKGRTAAWTEWVHFHLIQVHKEAKRAWHAGKTITILCPSKNTEYRWDILGIGLFHHFPVVDPVKHQVFLLNWTKFYSLLFGFPSSWPAALSQSASCPSILSAAWDESKPLNWDQDLHFLKGIQPLDRLMSHLSVPVSEETPTWAPVLVSLSKFRKYRENHVISIRGRWKYIPSLLPGQEGNMKIKQGVCMDITEREIYNSYCTLSSLESKCCPAVREHRVLFNCAMAMEGCLWCHNHWWCQ